MSHPYMSINILCRIPPANPYDILEGFLKLAQEKTENNKFFFD